MNRIEEINRPSTMYASTLLIGVSYLVYNMLPIILKSASDSMGLSEHHIGYLGSAYMAGSALSNIAAVFWVRLLNWRNTVALNTVLACICYLFAGQGDYQSLLILLFVIGVSNSAIVSCVYTLMGDMEKSDKAFGNGIGVQVVLAGLGSFLLPLFVIPTWGFQGVAVSLAVTALLTLPLLLWLPSRGLSRDQLSPPSTPRPDSQLKPHKVMVWGFIGIFIYFSGQSGIWAFFGKIGGDGGLTDVQLGSIFGITLIFSGVGGFLSGWFSSKFDRRLLISGAIFTGIFALVLLMMPLGKSYWAFTISFFLFCVSWNFIMPFLMTVVTEGDVEGKFTPLIPACQLMGSVMGPALSGHLIVDGSYDYVYALAIISVLICAVIFVCIDTMSRENSLPVFSTSH